MNHEDLFTSLDCFYSGIGNIFKGGIFIAVSSGSHNTIFRAGVLHFSSGFRSCDVRFPENEEKLAHTSKGLQ